MAMVFLEASKTGFFSLAMFMGHCRFLE